MFRRNTKTTALPLLGVAMINLGLFAYTLRMNKKNREWYLEQPKDKQRELYNTCPLQKYSSTNDAFAALLEHAEFYSSSQQQIPPRIPFDDAHPYSSDSTKKKR